ncbi:MAG: ABC transporter substrate-binding protein [Deltaproteobacteria bacterium]|jgi:polar amino acid transport system substrate-binding protein|nr:ABC transporter substrate-binding protein [Deltaproteobacteria bacterium]
MTMKNFLAAIFAFLLLLSASPPLSAQLEGRTFTNGMDVSFPPFCYISTDGTLTGFDIEALNWIARQMGFTVNHQPTDWITVIDKLSGREIDIIAGGLSVTPERRNRIAFTRPYWTVELVVLVRKDSALTAEDVLTGSRKIGVQKGSSEAQAMADSNGRSGRNYTLFEYGSMDLAASDVVNGRIQAAVFGDSPALEVMKRLSVKVAGPAGLPAETYAYGVSRDAPDLLQTLNQGLDLLKNDPYWNVLTQKYFPGMQK